MSSKPVEERKEEEDEDPAKVESVVQACRAEANLKLVVIEKAYDECGRVQ